MDFKDFFTKEKVKQEYYWALVLEPDWVQAAIWTVGDEKAQIVSISSSTAWDTDKELINACDTALSSAIQNLPKDIGEPAKTVFGVSSHWVENGEIKSQYLEKIKKICKELSLEPSGFIILAEGIAHFYKSEEGSPLTSVVIGIREENIEISLFRLGNLMGTTLVARSVSIPDDIIEGLTRFGSTEAYPSRFLIYNGREGELEDVKQNLLSFDWDKSEKVKFLHTPKIEIVSLEKKATATALAGASEISNIGKIESLQEEGEETKEYPSEVENVSSPEIPVKPEDLGFVVGKDVQREETQKADEAQTLTGEATAVTPKKEVLAKGFSLTKNGSKIASFVKDLFSKIKFKKFPGLSNRKTFVVGGTIIASLSVLTFLSWWFFPKATLTIYVSPKKLEDKLSLTIDTSVASSDFGSDILVGSLVEVSEQGEKTKSTTGNKTVGEKAHGTVKIQNGTSSIINLSAGAELIASNDLKFTIDTSASVSAAVSPSLPGEATVDVTSYDIGADYNLGKDEVFKVSNYLKSEVDAVAIDDFSGGSSKQISAVSEDDKDDLFEDLNSELMENAKTAIKQKIGEGDYLIEESVDATTSSKLFSSKVGDEASNLKLSLDLNVDGVVVNNADFYDFVKNKLQAKVPSGYVLRNEQVAIKFDLKEKEASKYYFNIVVEVNLLPQIDTKLIIEKVKGRDQKTVEEYLETVPGYSSAEVKYDPKLPGKLNILPHLGKNIEIELDTER